MTRSVASPSHLGVLWVRNLYRGFTLESTARRFFVLKTYPPLETDGDKRILVADSIPLVSSYSGD